MQINQRKTGQHSHKINIIRPPSGKEEAKRIGK